MIDVSEQIEVLTKSVRLMAQNHGTRLTREQLMDRFGICRSTLTKLEKKPDFPKSIFGKWLLSEIVDWELNHSRR